MPLSFEFEHYGPLAAFALHRPDIGRAAAVKSPAYGAFGNHVEWGGFTGIKIEAVEVEFRPVAPVVRNQDIGPGLCGHVLDPGLHIAAKIIGARGRAGFGDIYGDDLVVFPAVPVCRIEQVAAVGGPSVPSDFIGRVVNVRIRIVQIAHPKRWL